MMAEDVIESEVEQQAALPNWRNPMRNTDGSIDCEIEHPLLGWVPFTAAAHDVEEVGRRIFAEIESTAEEIPAAVVPIEEIAADARARIEQGFATRLAAGMPYTLPDGTDDVIQTRPDEDEANLLGLAIEARDLRAAGETDAVMSLRAKSNTVYTLTPEQMIALTDAAKNFKQGLLAKSWQFKDAITAAEAEGDRQAIETITWTTDTTTEEVA